MTNNGWNSVEEYITTLGYRMREGKVITGFNCSAYNPTANVKLLAVGNLFTHVSKSYSMEWYKHREVGITSVQHIEYIPEDMLQYAKYSKAEIEAEATEWERRKAEAALSPIITTHEESEAAFNNLLQFGDVPPEHNNLTSIFKVRISRRTKPSNFIYTTIALNYPDELTYKKLLEEVRNYKKLL